MPPRTVDLIWLYGDGGCINSPGECAIFGKIVGIQQQPVMVPCGRMRRGDLLEEEIPPAFAGGIPQNNLTLTALLAGLLLPALTGLLLLLPRLLRAAALLLARLALAALLLLAGILLVRIVHNRSYLY